MATGKTSAKAAAGKPAPKAVTATATKARTTVAVKPTVKLEPTAKIKATAKAAPKKIAKAAPKVAAPKPAASRAKKPEGVSAEQRRNYVEVAAYHIAERRGFAPGNTLDDWVQAEAEIDRLLAKGLLGG